jgi:hypothetical protein
MSGKRERGKKLLTANSKVLLAGVFSLFPLFPFIWIAASAFLSPHTVMVTVLSMECVVSIGVLFTKVHWKTRQAERRQAEIVAWALRNAPL